MASVSSTGQCGGEMSKEPQVHHPIAFCPEHGIFEMKTFAMDAGAPVNFIGSLTNCPQCGRVSEIIPGTYKADHNRLNILIDPSISPESLFAIRKIAEAAQAGSISAEDAKKEAEKIDPKAARLFDVANWSDQAKSTLYAAIIGATAVVGAARIASSPSQTTTVQPVIERVIERVIDKNDLLSTSSLSSRIKVPLPKPRPRKRR
jgi:hypothetical protein